MDGWKKAGRKFGQALIEVSEQTNKRERAYAMMVANLASKEVDLLYEEAMATCFREAARLAECGFKIVRAGFDKIALTITVETGERYPVETEGKEKGGVKL
jgi:hypothetical protein